MKNKVTLPTTEQILQLIDLKKVEEAIELPGRDGQKPKFSLDELRNIKEMVLSCAEHWLPVDLYQLEIIGIEKEYNNPRGFLDVEAIIKRPYFPSLKPFVGQKIVIDWKTTAGELDVRWKDKKIDSYQWRIYCHLADAPVFSYRGVSRKNFEGECPTREVLLAASHTNSEEVALQLDAVSLLREVLIDGKYEVWPRNFDSCHDFNRECPFKYDCDNYTMPRFVPEGKDLSHTSMQNFLRCPEFARRISGAPGADDSDESNIGKGTHSALAELYTQAMKIDIEKLL